MGSFKIRVRSTNNPRNLGFTLIEIMVSLTILGILASLAAPSFTQSIRRYRVNAIREELTASIQWARSEAIRRNLPILLVRTTGCGVDLLGSDDWSCGWEAVVDSNSNGAKNAGELVVQTTVIPTGYGVMHTNLGSVLQFNIWGQAQGIGQLFVITPPEGVSGPSTTTICINSGGRIRKLLGEATCT